jgi:tetratricopeptide (TPR) repeat protein/energy-coupling factor transporter ATP-binding protein EcfA2
MVASPSGVDAATFQPRRFRIVRCIGSGATGDVYEAVDRETGARFALKTLRHLLPHAIGRFKNEFRALLDINHPNLVSFGELIEEDGHLFFTMELVKGVDFLTWTAGNEERLRAALADLGHGLLQLHGAGKVHRDVKPSNVLVTADGRVVILDFGLLADSESGDTWSGQSIVGTPMYMAPEQAAGQSPGPGGDWYAVGVMLYEALTGKTPFDGPLMKILLDKQQTEPPPPESIAPDAPADLVALCKSLLRFDPAQRPSGETILRQLGGRSHRPSQPPTTPLTHGPPFVGRHVELNILRAMFDATRSQLRPHAVLVEGDSGVGKSTLVRVFARALESETAVLAGRCFERESVSYKAFDGVVEAIARLLSKLDPADAAAMLPLHGALLSQVFPALKRIKAFASAPLPQGDAPERELRTRAFGALRELLLRLTLRRPVVIVIDDLQWADEDSLALLGEILRPPEAPPVLVIATLRPTIEGTAAAAAAERVRAVCTDVRRVRLGPLAPDEARELAGILLHAHGVSTPVDLDALSREAAGHPLFLDELVRHLGSSGDTATGSLHLEDVVARRVAALDARARDVVELVAVAGHPLYLETFARAADVPPDSLGRLVSALRVSNLVRSGGIRPTDTIEPYHDRVRDAILAGVDDERRQSLHLTLAGAIEGSPHPAQEQILAFHWEGAGRNDVAARHAAAAGQRALETLAFDQAARAFRWALDLGHRDRANLCDKLGDALGNIGRGAAAADAYLAAAEHVGVDAVAVEMRRKAAEQLLISGHIDRGMRLITQVLAALGMKLPATPNRALASLLLRRARLRLRGIRFEPRHESEVAATELTRVDMCWSVATGLAMVDVIRGADFQTRHLLLALDAGEPTRVAKALAVEGGFLSTQGKGGRKRALKLFAAAREHLDRTPSAFAMALLLGAECVHAYQGGRWTRALELAREAERAISDQGNATGVAWQHDTIHFFLCYALFYLGKLDELASLTPTLLRAANERGDLYAATNLRVGIPNAAWLVPDQPAQAGAELDLALAQWTVNGFHLQHYHHLLGLGQLHLYTGEAAKGYAALAERWAALEGSLILRVELVRNEAYLLRARLALLEAQQEPSRRDARLREARRLIKPTLSGGPGMAGMGELAAAGLAASLGDHDDAVARLRRAVAQLDTDEMATYAAVARLRLGALLAGDEGAALRAAGTAHLAANGVVAPAKFAQMLAPGFATE